MYTLLRESFMPRSIISVKSLPARPTKGVPCASSSAPGASPRKTKRAVGLPSAKTVCVRVDASSVQRVHAAVGRHGAAGRHQRLARDLPAEHPLAVLLRAAAAEEVHLQRLEVEDPSRVVRLVATVTLLFSARALRPGERPAEALCSGHGDDELVPRRVVHDTVRPVRRDEL